MKLIITPNELSKEFERLAKQYNEYYWTVAWAGASSKQFDNLRNNQDKIRKIVVGLHFYQTHPDFISFFLKNEYVRFVQQPQGTFHPKVYLFYNTNEDWEILIGSANFTNEAFTKNTEAITLIKSSDDPKNEVLKTAFGLVNSAWNDARQFTEKELENYQKTWKNLRPKLNSLSGLYRSTGNRKVKPIYEVPVTHMTWEEFIERVRTIDPDGVKRRLKVIETTKKMFERKVHFCDLTDDERKFIAGIPNKFNKNDREEIWAYFGSMRGAGIFKNRIIENDKNISSALDQIPLKGQITRAHYDNYIQYFTKAFDGDYIATATRLLAMKRPDTFYCLTSKNQKQFCKDFDLVYSNIDYIGYWEDVIERIYDSEWWLNPKPTTQEEIEISEARAAYLDAIYYEYE
ncbi:phospholipase D family protein [Xanthocytophaga flava]|uniref:phospholipase D family protein n=1 Tax=Xanthocytophaga flava TaxID=3048013 RepID=UPI0028D04845|nr:phospholipase D family protein [Xanthocytophaga flavus]MDJ1466951.1 phospholipase D family protein [Xanthocytophaga flavus]